MVNVPEIYGPNYINVPEIYDLKKSTNVEK